MSIIDEIHTAMNDIQKKLDADSNLNDQDVEMLLLSSLIEDEA